MTTEKKYLRFPLSRRIEHWVTVFSFTVLALTGLPQKYIGSIFSELLIASLGGIETIRIIHRVAAIALMLVSIYHLGTMIYHWWVSRAPLTMLPSKEDLKAAWTSVRFNFGLEKKEPKQGFYTFEEKFEYWALIWGTVIMILTGFFLWNPITASKALPANWIPAAKAAHGNEALLAVLAIIFWHMYHVLIKHFNRSMYTGYMTHEEMEEYHALVLENPLKAVPQKSEEEFKRRQRIFTAVYGVTSAVLLAITYWFVTTEDTALAHPDPIEMLPPLESFGPPEATAYPDFIPVGNPANIGTTWDDGIDQFFNDRCGTCHRAGGGPAHLDMETYLGVLRGGDSGPAVVPYYPGISLALLWHQKGTHHGSLQPDEITALQLWILAGAPE